MSVAQTLQSASPPELLNGLGSYLLIQPDCNICRFNDLVQELESANDNIRATERSRDHFQAQLQQVGLPLCSTGQCWGGSLIVASNLALSWKCSGAMSAGTAAPVKGCLTG